MAGRRRRLALALTGVVTLVLILTVIFLLPVVVRRVAVNRLTTMTGRAVGLERVELNLFTGRVALNRFRLAQRGSAEPAVEVERLEVRVAPTSLVRNDLRVVEL